MDKSFEKFVLISQTMGIFFLVILATIDKDILPVIVGFLIGWLIAVRRK